MPGARISAAAAIALACVALVSSGCTGSSAERGGGSDAVVERTDDGLRIASSSHRPYSRDAFGSGWADTDGDCLDTRAEILIASSSIRPTLAGSGCSVVSGRWRDAYTGATVSDARSLDIDHVVPLAEAWRSGAWKWSDDRRERFANETGKELLPVNASLNRSKGDQDPADWLPPNGSARCAYATRWIAIKRRWGLAADRREADALARVLRSC